MLISRVEKRRISSLPLYRVQRLDRALRGEHDGAHRHRPNSGPPLQLEGWTRLCRHQLCRRNRTRGRRRRTSGSRRAWGGRAPPSGTGPASDRPSVLCPDHVTSDPERDCETVFVSRTRRERDPFPSALRVEHHLVVRGLFPPSPYPIPPAGPRPFPARSSLYTADSRLMSY